MKRDYYSVIDSQGYYLIAEIGVNYYEIAEMNDTTPLNAAKLMIREAKLAGADAVKFQTYKAENLVQVDSPGSWDRNDISIDTQYELFKLYDHFGEREYKELFEYCKDIEIEFMSTPFDIDSANYLDKYVNVYKISSSDITNIPLIECIAKKNKPIILSVGAADKEEIDSAVQIIEKYNSNRITLMHCVLEYPTPYEHANLSKITTLCSAYPNVIVGYSDHTKPDKSMDILKMAYILGARVIEKHFTLDKTIKKRNDHFHSMDTDDLQKAREGIEICHRAYGQAELCCLPSEIKTRDSVRRSAVAIRNILIGEILEENMIVFKRPSSGIPATSLNDILGRRVIREIQKDEQISYDSLEVVK